MIPLLAKNAVRLKCTYQEAGMTGNYECAYALGIVSAYTGQEMKDLIEDFQAFKQQVMENAGDYQGSDSKMKRLFELINEYEASEVNDEQILELYHMGYEDKTI